MKLWGDLSDIYGGPQRTELGRQPHISLTSFESREPLLLCREVDSLAERFSAFPMRLGSVEYFATAEGVIYLAPDPCTELNGIHAYFHERLTAHGTTSHPYYQPGQWIPHCTVATDVPEGLRKAVMESPHMAASLGEVRVETIHIVAHRPFKDLYHAVFTGNGATHSF